ncbi:hypothetical protein ACFPJ2_00030 [Microbacterium suwonense]|uniref:hypothetical protein n=1 Tax=Microbacterium suwonense TaxID=683047 RepID=UPI0036141943
MASSAKTDETLEGSSEAPDGQPSVDAPAGQSSAHSMRDNESSHDDAETPGSARREALTQFQHVAEPYVRSLKADVESVRSAVEENGPVPPAVAALRERGVSLRAVTPPSDRAAVWHAMLDELDRWIALAETGASAHDPMRLQAALSNIERNLSELESVTGPSS